MLSCFLYKMQNANACYAINPMRKPNTEPGVPTLCESYKMHCMPRSKPPCVVIQRKELSYRICTNSPVPVIRFPVSVSQSNSIIISFHSVLYLCTAPKGNRKVIVSFTVRICTAPPYGACRVIRHHHASGLSPTELADDSSSVSFSDGGGVGRTGLISKGTTFTSKGAYVI